MCGSGEAGVRQERGGSAAGERPTIGENRNGEGLRQGRWRGSGLIGNGRGGGGGGGGLFMVLQEDEGPSPFLFGKFPHQ